MMPAKVEEAGGVSPRAAVPQVPAAPPPFVFGVPGGPGEEERSLEYKRQRQEKGDEDDDERKQEDGGMIRGRSKMPKARARGWLKIKRSLKITDAKRDESDEDKGVSEEDEKGLVLAQKKKEDEEKQDEEKKRKDKEKEKQEQEDKQTKIEDALERAEKERDKSRDEVLALRTQMQEIMDKMQGLEIELDKK